MKQGTIATGVGVGLGALLAFWWYRRRQGGIGPLGLTFPSWVTGARPSSSTTDLAIAAGKQVARAVAGQRLTDYRKAEDMQLFWNTAEDDASAYWKSAYWMAVASRLSGDASLARAAVANQLKGNALGGVPGSSLKTGGIAGIFSDAARQVTQVAKGNRQVSAIAKTLAGFSDPKLIAAWQQNVEESSTTGIVKGTVAASAEDAGTVAGVLRGIFSGELPRGMDPTRWFFMKWGLRIGLVTASGIGIWLLVSPKVRKAAAAASSLGVAGKEFAQRAKLALTAAQGAAKGTG